MKKTIYSTFLLLFVAFYGMAQTANVKVESGAPGAAPNFEWVETTHNFGDIPQGTPVTYEFEFVNSGQVPLIISNVRGSCGCTVTDYSKEPVAPGEKGMVKATYNAKALGAFNKSIRVTANVEGGSEVLYIKGKVLNQ
jgi:hypothetical protein